MSRPPMLVVLIEFVGSVEVTGQEGEDAPFETGVPVPRKRYQRLGEIEGKMDRYQRVQRERKETKPSPQRNCFAVLQAVTENSLRIARTIAAGSILGRLTVRDGALHIGAASMAVEAPPFAFAGGLTEVLFEVTGTR